MIEVNLVPDVKQELLKAQAQRSVVISVAILAAIAAGVVVVLVAGYVYGAQTLLMQASNNTIDEEYQKLSQVADLDKMLTVQNQLNAVSSLNTNKQVSSRLYDMLNVVVPHAPHSIRLSSILVQPAEESGGIAGAGKEAVITLEGQTVGSYASLEVFEKTIAAAVIEYKFPDTMTATSEMECSDEGYQCRYLAVGGGDRATAVRVLETSFGEDQNGAKTLFFKLNFTVVPELFSNSATDVRLKIGKDGNVTDSYLGIPRAIFENRPVEVEENR